MNLTKKFYSAIYTIIACAPIVWSTLFYGLAFDVAHRLGRWPILHRDTPKVTVPDGFPYDWIEITLELLGLGLLLLIPVWIGMACFIKLKLIDRPTIPTLRIYRLTIELPTLLFIIGSLVLVVIGIWDPHKLFDWWMD